MPQIWENSMVKNWAAFCSYPNAPGVLEKLDARLSPNLGKVWFSVVFHGFLWFFMVFCGFAQFLVVLCCLVWFLMVPHGFLRKSCCGAATKQLQVHECKRRGHAFCHSISCSQLVWLLPGVGEGMDLEPFDQPMGFPPQCG